MTPKEQRIAIAEACGIKAEKYIRRMTWTWGGEMHYHPPDYLNDLNAMHDAEWTLTAEQHATFREKLREIQSLTAGVYEDYERAYLSAPAEDRAEAFLRTIGKWNNQTKGEGA